MAQENTTINNAQKENFGKLIPVTKWNEYYDFPTIGGLRALIFNAKKNGFEKVIRRVGSRVLIKEDAYFDWIEEIQKNGGKYV